MCPPSSETRLAFAHPAERAAATTGSDALDRISVRDHTVEVEIGAFQAERGVTQRICFNVVVEVRPLSGPIHDDVDRILSYDRVTEAIQGALATERLALLETLAERVAERILREPQAMRVFVRIEKLDRGPGALGVEIVRARDGAPPPEIVRRSRAPAGACLSQQCRHRIGASDRLARPAACAGPPVGALRGRPARGRTAGRASHGAAPDRPAGDRAERMGAGRAR